MSQARLISLWEAEYFLNYCSREEINKRFVVFRFLFPINAFIALLFGRKGFLRWFVGHFVGGKDNGETENYIRIKYRGANGIIFRQVTCSNYLRINTVFSLFCRFVCGILPPPHPPRNLKMEFRLSMLRIEIF